MFWLICAVAVLLFLQFFWGIPVIQYLWMAIGLPIRFAVWVNRKVRYRRRFGRWLSDELIDSIEWVEGEVICRELNRNSVYYAKKLLGMEDSNDKD